MNLLKSIWQRILALDNQPLNDRISELEALLDTEILRCNKLTNQYKIDQPKPNLDIDFTKKPYTGTNANIFYNSKTKKLETNYSLITISKYYRFWNDEFYTGVMKAYNRDKPDLNNVREVMLFARNILFNDFGFVYHSDTDHEGKLKENWKTIPQIWADKRIDCVAYYEEIYTIDGTKKIKDLREGDLVLSYDFKSKKYCYKPITNIWDKGKLQINRVHFRNGTHIDVSEDHPMLATTSQKYINFEKIPLSQIEIEKWWKNKVPFTKQLPYVEKDVDWLTKDLCFVIGHFFAEGWVQKKDKNSKSVFTSGYDCPEYIAPILEKYDIPFTEHKNNSGVPCIRFKSSKFKEFLQTLKVNSFEFTIPDWLSQLPKQKLEAILEGHFLGDGHYRTKPFECRQYSTSSDQLKEFLYEISLKLGKPLYCYNQVNHQGAGKRPIWRLDDNKNSVFRRPIGYKGLSGLSISYIEKLNKTQMYDFEVKDTHNFVFKNGVITHNCEDFSICVIAICNILGIPSDKVFMITGYYGNGGHAYPGFIDSDNKVKIVEATNNAYPVTVMKGSFYTSKGNIAGISNWAWKGVPRIEQL